ncbi:uncharacterized protein N7482_009011 [Penicillium canariense]|uniref:Uncharacterized protein n=1 Tax=Penicillium canariense TaxID=189055 RepID=A0A9W9HXP5_9EURO|nr:uncharacterized protein N7482_009011 [Penicillium canariense]KAJ5157911.1 hypothetical protein N7482_009011 [Penicillium canariense]
MQPPSFTVYTEDPIGSTVSASDDDRPLDDISWLLSNAGGAIRPTIVAHSARVDVSVRRAADRSCETNFRSPDSRLGSSSLGAGEMLPGVGLLRMVKKGYFRHLFIREMC